jgi:hypothetical protein
LTQNVIVGPRTYGAGGRPFGPENGRYLLPVAVAVNLNYPILRFTKYPILQFSMFENWLAGRCAPSAVPLVDDVNETSEMARQNGKELSYPLHRQGQVCVDVYGRCCGSIVAKKLASLGRSSTRFNLDKA